MKTQSDKTVIVEAQAKLAVAYPGRGIQAIHYPDLNKEKWFIFVQIANSAVGQLVGGGNTEVEAWADAASDIPGVDYTIKKGDFVLATDWPKPVQIVDVNWSLNAAAVRLSVPTGKTFKLTQSVVIWPLASLIKVEDPRKKEV